MGTNVFLEILAGRIPCQKVYEDEQVLAFHDISPAAPVHIVVIPKKVINTANDLTPEDEQLVGHLVLVAQKLAVSKGIAEPGFRLVMNCNEHGGQTVNHLHLHLLGGRALSWPPG